MIALHNIFVNAPDAAPRMADAMVPIYETLIDRAPGSGDWATARDRALEIAH